MACIESTVDQQVVSTKEPEISVTVEGEDGSNDEIVGPILVGRVKSFSQKSGWGFIQLFEGESQDPEKSKDVFFHRADVARSGTAELRPGILVHCCVVSTGKGEKASGISILDGQEEDEEEQNEQAPSTQMPYEQAPEGQMPYVQIAGVTVVPDVHPIHQRALLTPSSSLTFPRSTSTLSDDPISHSPYSGEFSTTVHGNVFENPFVASASTDSISSVMSHRSYSSYRAETYTGWECTDCAHRNVVQSLLRVTVMCASCSSVRAVENWLCMCSKTNSRESRYCGACELPYSQGCVRLFVRSPCEASEESKEEPKESPAAEDMSLSLGKRMASRRLRARSGWQHTQVGWSHGSLGAAQQSSWLQDNSDGKEPVSYGRPQQRHQALFERCKSRLLWARDWLLKGAPVGPEDEELTPEWLYRFSEDVCSPQHQLLCPTRGFLAFVPNPCADLEDGNVLQMYEVIGMVLALAVAHQVPLHPALPVWMARSLLGYPTTMQDLGEFDPQLCQKAETVMKHQNVESLKMMFTQEIKKYGVSRSFEMAEGGPDVTEENKHKYGVWLKDVYLSKSVETQLKRIKWGFFYTLMGDSLLQGLTPVEFSNVVNGERVLDVDRVRKSLRICNSLRSYQPHLEKWLLEAVQFLSARQWQLFLRFATGFSKAPHGGASGVKQNITFTYDPSLPLNSLPVAYKTTNELRLPQYTAPAVLRQMLTAALGAQTQGFTGF